MKKSILAILTASLISMSAAFADSYKASMTGIQCSGCKKKIVTALGAIEGVQSVRLAPLKKKGQHVLKVITEDGAPEITLAQAKKAVAIAEHYQLHTWEKTSKK